MTARLDSARPFGSVFASLLLVAPALGQRPCPDEVLLQSVDVPTSAAVLRSPKGAPVIGGDFAFQIEDATPGQRGVLFLYAFDAPPLPTPGRATAVDPFDVGFGVPSAPEPAPFLTTFFVADGTGASPLLIDTLEIAEELCGIDATAQALLFDASAASGFTLTNTLRVRVGVPNEDLFPPVHPVASSSPEAMRFADMNNDGLSDLIGIRNPEPSYFDSVYVSLGLPDGGKLQASSTQLFARTPEDLEVADFDGDGNPDVVTANSGTDVQPSGVSLLLGDGAGGFGSFADHPTFAGSRAVAISDFDQDGNVDVATANLTAGSLSVLLGDGAGGLAAPAYHLVGVQPYDVAAADLDVNGFPDLVTTLLGEASIGVLLGSGGASFAPVAKHAAAVAPISVAVADFDEDSVLDVVNTNNSPGSLSLFLGTGSGGFATAVQIPVGIEPMDLVVADLDGDAHQDIVTSAHFEDAIWVLSGDGSGNFSSASYPTRNEPEDLGVDDFDRDGVPDLYVVQAGHVCAHLGAGDGTFPGEFGTFVSGDSFELAAFADMDGDGLLDIVASSSARLTVSVFLGNGDGTFEPPIDRVHTTFAEQMLVDDFDGDGAMDVFVGRVGFGTVPWAVMLGNGDGTLAPEVVTSGARYALARGDFDEDGVLDLVIHTTNVPLDLQVLLGNGDGTFGGPVAQLGFNALLGAALVADLDEDGHLDLVAGDTGFGRVLSWLGDGSGGFGPIQQTSFGPGTPATYSLPLTLADLDRDGVREVVSTGDGGFRMPLLPSGSFGAAVAFDAGGGVANPVDFDGNGTLDFVSSTVFRSGNGDLTYRQTSYCPGLFAASDFGDVDGDGIPDMVAPSTEGILLYLNRLGE